MKKKAKKKPAPRPKREPPAETNERMPMCRICNHRHSGVDHVWKK